MCNVQNLGESVSILNDRFNSEVVDNKISTLQTMDPIFAGMLSAVVPGLGQFVSDNPLVGISYLIPAGVLARVLSFPVRENIVLSRLLFRKLIVSFTAIR